MCQEFEENRFLTDRNLRAPWEHVEVERGDGVGDAVELVPGRRVLSAEDQQRAGLRSCHQPIAAVVGDLDGDQTQDGTGGDLLQEVNETIPSKNR